MSIYLHTYPGHEVEAINDARLYKQLTGNACGMVEGGTVTRAGGAVLHIAAGWGVVNGRLFTIQAEDITAELATSGTMAGAVYLHFDTSAEEVAQILTTTGASIEAIRAQLTFDDITAGGIENNIILATYDVTTVAIDGAVTTADPVTIEAASTSTVRSMIETATAGAFKYAYVNALPASPDANTYYFIPES